MYARSNCSVSPAAAETAGSISGIPVAFMESWPARAKRLRMELRAPPAKAMRHLVVKVTQQFDLLAKPRQRFELLVKAMQRALKANQLAARRQVSENRPAQANPVRLSLALAVWRSDLPLRAFFAQARQQ